MNTVLSAVPTGACHSDSVNIDCRHIQTDRQTDRQMDRHIDTL